MTNRSALLKRRAFEAFKSGLLHPLRRAIAPRGVENTVRRDWHFTRDDTARPRLTLVLPSLSQAQAFGGVTTGLQLFLTLAAELKAMGTMDIRIAPEAPLDAADNVLPRMLKGTGLKDTDIEVWPLAANGDRIPTRRLDIFMVYNWWTALNIEAVLRAQAAEFAQPPLPKLYIIQEYEPHFYPMSSAQMLALQAFNGDWPLWGVFNSSELHAYYTTLRNRADRAFVFEPRLTPAIAAFAHDLKPEEKTRTVLVYGRPQIDRNCFVLLRDGLQHFARTQQAGTPWRIVSAGTPHRDIDLGGGLKLQSLGKLSLEAYGGLLRETAIGISLMASCHPSYPPLEMAHFGVRTITNTYLHKDLTQRHENIVNLPNILPDTIAATLARTMAAFEADPAGGLRAKSHMPYYLDNTDFDCMPALRDAVAGLIFADVPAADAVG